MPVATKPTQFGIILDTAKAIRDGALGERAARKIVPFVSLMPSDPDWSRHLEETAAAGIKGLKVHPYYQNFSLSDPSVWPFFVKIADLGLVVQCHCGYDIGYPGRYVEVYDPKVTNNFKNTISGVSGTKTIECLAIPRAGGTYTIPPVLFSYYDTQAEEYRTVSTPEYILNIARAANEDATSAVVNTFVQKEDIQQLGSDIRYIYMGDLTPTKHNEKQLIAFGSLAFWMCYLVPSLLAALLFIIFRKQIKENADITRVRYKKANKVAQRRLKAAEQLLKANEKEAFFEEIARAAWTYLSDRLSIPTAQLNKENIAQILANKGVSDSLVREVLHMLSTAEFARYAPTSDHAMQDLYNETTTIINQLENEKL